MSEQQKDQPAESKVDDYAPSYPEPQEATEVPPESSSPTKGMGTAEWECMTCGRRYSEDLGRCPDDGAPLRKTGPHAAPVGERHIADESRQPMERAATRPDQTPEGYGKPGSHGKEPAEGQLQGEQAAPDRGRGESAG